MTTPTLPPLPIPYPPALHPNFDESDMEGNRHELATRAYRDRFQLYDTEDQRRRLGKIYCAWLGSLMYPKGTDELLQIGIDFCTWGFAYDDEYCDEGPLSRDPETFIEVSSRIYRAYESPEVSVSDDRYALAMQDLRRRLDLYSTPTHTARFGDSLRAYLMTEMWKIVQPKPTVNDYIPIRQYGGGGWSYPVLCHIIAGVDISEDEYHDRRVRALDEMMTAVLAWDTDPYAYVKEGARSSHKEHNLIMALMREHACSFDEAISRYMAMRAKVISLFIRLRADVEATCSPEVRAYIECQTKYWAGAMEWTANTNRYHSIAGLGDTGSFSGGKLVREAPEETFDRIGLSSCAWWWEYDPVRR